LWFVKQAVPQQSSFSRAPATVDAEWGRGGLEPALAGDQGGRGGVRDEVGNGGFPLDIRRQLSASQPMRSHGGSPRVTARERGGGYTTPRSTGGVTSPSRYDGGGGDDDGGGGGDLSLDSRKGGDVSLDNSRHISASQPISGDGGGGVGSPSTARGAFTLSASTTAGGTITTGGGGSEVHYEKKFRSGGGGGGGGSAGVHYKQIVRGGGGGGAGFKTSATTFQYVPLPAKSAPKVSASPGAPPAGFDKIERGRAHSG